MTQAMDEWEPVESLRRFSESFLQNLDCDGSTRFNAIMLDKLGIKYSIFVGKISNKKYVDGVPYQSFEPHFWIETEHGLLVDFKSKKWIGSEGLDEVMYSKKQVISDKEMWITAGLSREKILAALLSWDGRKIILCKEDIKHE